MGPANNFKRPRRRHNPHASIDGIISPNSFKKRSSIDFGRSSPGRNIRSTTMDDFKRSDGFHPAYQPVITPGGPGQGGKSPAAALPEQPPVVTKSLPTKLRRRRILGIIPFGRKKVPKVKKPLTKKVLVLRGAGTAVIIFVLIGGFLFAKGYLKARKAFSGQAAGAAALQGEVDPRSLKVEGDGRINILLLGKGGLGHEGADLTDTILLMSIDPVHKEAGILSVPRDLFVRVPGDGSEKINAVYANSKSRVLNSGRQTSELKKKAENAGLDSVQTVVSQVLGVPIHYRTMIDFEGFRQAIDTVGGVTINVKTQLYDPTVAWENNYNPLIAPVGVQTFNGKKALLYSRSRHGSARGDFDRAQRQREVLLALKEKVLSSGTYANPVKVSQLFSNFGDHINSDLSINEVMKLYSLAKSIPSKKVVSIGLADPPHELVSTGNVGGLSVVIPKLGVYEYADIHNYVRNTLRDSYLKKENAAVMVLNGTNIAGLATQKSTMLKSYGYRLGQVGDAPTKNYPRTILVDLHGNKKYTKHYLEKRFKVVATSSLPDKTIIPNPPGADFVIILGQNEAS